MLQFYRKPAFNSNQRRLEPIFIDRKLPQKEKLHILWNLSTWNKLKQSMVQHKGRIIEL
jgi:hypothetical protein